MDFDAFANFVTHQLLLRQFETVLRRIRRLAHEEFPPASAAFSVWRAWALAAYQLAVEADYVRLMGRGVIDFPVSEDERFVDYKVTTWLQVVLEWGREVEDPLVLRDDRGCVMGASVANPIDVDGPEVVASIPAGWALSELNALESPSMPSLEPQPRSPSIAVSSASTALDSAQEMVGVLYAVIAAMRSGDTSVGRQLMEVAREGLDAVGSMMGTASDSLRGRSEEEGAEECVESDDDKMYADVVTKSA
ncbi:hypothetical protein Hypma_006022 [Hypsizygus marmoreus]|uniref:Uncharacterized protein n=1 Tax=Hypsizygus marmoreus TaxID=39966 RepID=A0A369K3L1_HYPMA|nr:hypothetical protein Hypma_006022 [Hypsizygus marmoreus]